MRFVELFIVFLAFVSAKRRKDNNGLQRKLPYNKFNHDTELQGAQFDPDQSFRNWQQLVQNEDDLETSSDFQRDFKMSTKSTGSENFNTVEVIPGPRGPAGPPGILVLEEFAQTLELLRDTEGDIRKSRKGRYKSGGPVLNIVFSSLRNPGTTDSQTISNQSGGRLDAGFYSSLRTDIYLQRLSRLQLSNFLKPRAGPTTFIFNTGLEFDHRSGTLTAGETGVYFITATINLQRIPADETELPEFEDNITARICMDDECLAWALETKIPVVHSKYASLTLNGVVRIEAGNNGFLFVENNSGLNFKVLRSSGFSACVMGPGD